MRDEGKMKEEEEEEEEEEEVGVSSKPAFGIKIKINKIQIMRKN